MSMLTEADTCRKYLLPRLYAAGWTDEKISKQKSFTDGRIVVAGDKPTRHPQKRADYLLKYSPRLHPGGRGGKAPHIRSPATASSKPRITGGSGIGDRGLTTRNCSSQ
jgi:hypothetical protein